MRRCWLLLVLAGCIHGSSSPAWPKSSSSSDDGGESLAPRAAAHELTAQADDSTSVTPAAPPTATPAASPTAAPTATPAVTPPPEEPVQTEEMVIEIEDD